MGEVRAAAARAALERLSRTTRAPRPRGAASSLGFVARDAARRSRAASSSRRRGTRRVSSGTGRSAGRSAASRRSRSGTGGSTTRRASPTCTSSRWRSRCCSCSARSRSGAGRAAARRSSSPRSRARVLIGFELVLTHWFYLYLPWFFPFVAIALLCRAAGGAGRGAAAPMSIRARSLSLPAERRVAGLLRSRRWSSSRSWALLHTASSIGARDHRHAGLREVRRRDARRRRCRTATSRSSTRRARCRCSSRRRSATRGTRRLQAVVRDADGLLRRGAVDCARVRVVRARRSGVRFFAALALAAVSPLLLGSRRSDPVRPLACGADSRLRSRRSSRGGSGWDTGCSAQGSSRRSGRECSFRSRSSHVLAHARQARGARLPRRRRRRRGGRRAAARRARAARRLDELRASALASVTDREPRCCADRRLASRLRHGRHDDLEQRFAEPRRHDGGRGRLGATVLQLSALLALWIVFARAGARARSSFSSRRRPSWRSWRSARSRRRSS